MPTLPTESALTGTSNSKENTRLAFVDLRAFIAALLGTAGTQSAALTAMQAPLNGILPKTAAYNVVAADRGKLIDYTTAGVTLTLPTVATAGAGYCIGIRNSAASGDLTIGRNSGNIDGAAANITLLTGESTLIVCDGSAGWKTVGRSAAPATPNVQTFTTPGSSNWLKPAKGTMAIVEVWGAGGSGGKDSAYGGGGGAGGGYSRMTFPLSALPSSVSVTIASGGAAKTTNGNGNPGAGDTTFGSYLSAGPGAGGAQGTNVAGIYGGVDSIAAGGIGLTETGGAGAGKLFTVPGEAATTNINAESTQWAGAGGGSYDGIANTSISAGTSTNGGDGGAASGTTATAGEQPGGGGGASEDGNSGAGGNGKCIVTVV